MAEECDEPVLMGQLAGIIAMMSALVKTLPPATRGRLHRQIHAEFESLLSAMSTTGEAHAQVERSSVEWMRDLFLKRIEQSDSKRTSRRHRKGSADSARNPAPGNQPPVVERRAPTDVDFEL